MRKLFAFALLFALPAHALAWNEKGHLVTARLAWRQISEEQRARAVAVLRKQPHYDEYLAARRPEGFAEEEWAFMRAAAWPDWVRSHHREYDRPTWHYVNYPIIPPGSAVDPAAHQPPPRQENVVKQLPVCVEKVRSGSDEKKAVCLCWLFHLVGDVHQPLHCTAVYSERFPDGDRGGNLALVRIRTSPVNLHSFWDGLLGTGMTAGNIGADVREIEAVMQAKAEDVHRELDAHPTFESWAREGAELSKRVVYLDGQLKVAVSSGRRGGGDDDAPPAPADYAPACGRVARVQVGKAGLRLAGLRLAGQLKQLFP